MTAAAAVLSVGLGLSGAAPAYAGVTGKGGALNLPGLNSPAGNTGSTSSGTAQMNGTAAAGETPVVMNGLFGGGELRMLANQSASQMESFILKSKSGKLVVVDGGMESDEAHLRDVLLSEGGHVSAWLIAHPHSDHVGALTKLLNEGNPGITIDNVYYNFAAIEWYQENESYRAQMVADCAAALNRLSPEVLHSQVKKGDVITVDDIRITVMNSPFLFSVNAINNSSVAYRVELNGKKIMFLGDLGVEAGNSFLNEYQGQDLKCDIVQMAHHGDNGVSQAFYERLRPSVCLWNAPAWLWNDDSGNGTGSGNWQTLEVRKWMSALGVKSNFAIKDGDQILR